MPAGPWCRPSVRHRLNPVWWSRRPGLVITALMVTTRSLRTHPRDVTTWQKSPSTGKPPPRPWRRWACAGSIIRTGVVLSAQGGALPRMLLPFRLLVGGRMGSGRQWVPWVHIADEAAAIRFLIDDPSAQGAFNLTAPAPVTNSEFSRLLGNKLKRPSFTPLPGFVLRLVIGEMATVVLDGQRAVPRRLLEAGFKFRFTEADSALSDLLERTRVNSRR